MGKTKIPWAEYVWNPISGCTRFSEGCVNCYAYRRARLLAGRCGYPKVDPFQVTLHRDKIDEPLHWKKPRLVFVCSMGDLFHPAVENEWIGRIFGVMASCPQHTFIVLTKRPQRMYDLLHPDVTGPLKGEACQTAYEIACRSANIKAADFKLDWPLPNVWLGVTAENQNRANERIPILLQTPAAVRFVSIEPMLDWVDLVESTDICGSGNCLPPVDGFGKWLHWVIVGCESGPGRRQFDYQWARQVRDQCVEYGVPFYFKQAPDQDGKVVEHPELDGVIWKQYPKHCVPCAGQRG